VVTCRPADLLSAELDQLENELLTLADEHAFELAQTPIDDVLTYALFPQIGLKFLKNLNNPTAFEQVPMGSVVQADAKGAEQVAAPAAYSARVDGRYTKLK
jgi:oxaloacetate decarboxylase alpha subunit